MKKSFVIILLFLSSSVFISSKVLIFTYAYNRPDFIEKQYLTFEHFLQDEYEFVVFNDAVQRDSYIAIENMCKKYDIQCVPIPQNIHKRHEPAERNCAVVKYSLEEMGFNHDDILVLIDSDLFLVNDFSFKKYMKNYDVVGHYQNRLHVNYLWIGLVILNMGTMPNKNTINFYCGTIDNIPVDAGGHSYYYLKNNPAARVQYVQQPSLETIHRYVSDKKSLSFVTQMTSSDFFVVNNELIFLHYRAATNWDHKSSSFHEQKTKVFNGYFDYILSKKH